MKGKVKTIGFVVGVDCANQPIVVKHHIEPEKAEKNVSANFGNADVKPVKHLSYSAKHAKAKRHCGQSQKDIRLDHK